MTPYTVSAAADRLAWSQVAVEEVGDEIFRIPLPLPSHALRAVNVYLVADADGALLIDGGWAFEAAEEAIEKGLAAIGSSFADIREILVTHIHRDHFTQAIAIRRKYGTPVSLGAGERSNLE